MKYHIKDLSKYEENHKISFCGLYNKKHLKTSIVNYHTAYFILKEKGFLSVCQKCLKNATKRLSEKGKLY